MVTFGGWEMPVQYTGIIEEHRAVRRAVGLFDISHMGEFEVVGAGSLAALQRLTTNDVTALEVGQVQYSLLCYPSGGIVDDLTVYRLGEDRFTLTVNAANSDKDWAWVSEHGKGARWRDVSTETVLLAVQGPKAERCLQQLAEWDLSGIAYYRCVEGRVAGVHAVISRTGYTGEDGFELYIAAGDAERLWFALLDVGQPDGIMPVGLGARDTLRLEMCYALYGNDIDETTNPLEAGLGWVVKLGKGEFIGRSAIERVKAEGPRRKLVGFEMLDRAVARHGYRILKDDRQAGVVTSGSYGPAVDKYIGLGYVGAELARVGTEIDIEVRGTPRRAHIVPTPFYSSRVKKG
jgi:aminomethyltransferase